MILTIVGTLNICLHIRIWSTAQWRRNLDLVRFWIQVRKRKGGSMYWAMRQNVSHLYSVETSLSQSCGTFSFFFFLFFFFWRKVLSQLAILIWRGNISMWVNNCYSPRQLLTTFDKIDFKYHKIYWETFFRVLHSWYVHVCQSSIHILGGPF